MSGTCHHLISGVKLQLIISFHPHYSIAIMLIFSIFLKIPRWRLHIFKWPCFLNENSFSPTSQTCTTSMLVPFVTKSLKCQDRDILSNIVSMFHNKRSISVSTIGVCRWIRWRRNRHILLGNNIMRKELAGTPNFVNLSLYLIITNRRRSEAWR